MQQGGGVPVPLFSGGGQGKAGLPVRLEHGGIALTDLPGPLAEAQPAPQKPGAVLRRLPSIFQNHPLPRGRVPGGGHCHLFRQPLLREGMALHEPVQGKGHLHQPVVVPLGGKGVRQLSGRAAAVEEPGHGLLQGLVHHLLLPLVRKDLELRGEAQQVEELPHHLRAEAVHCADMGLAQQDALAAQKRVPGILTQHFEKPGLQPGAHFRRRRLGERDDEQPVGGGGVLPAGEPFYRPLYQHRRLSRARRSRHQHRAPPGLHRVPLALGPLHKTAPLEFASTRSWGFTPHPTNFLKKV